MVCFLRACDIFRGVLLILGTIDDQTNLHRHARHNAQEAIALAKRKAQEFDTQAALERKTNEALKLAKAQAHIRADEDVSGSSGTPLVDRMYPVLFRLGFGDADIWFSQLILTS